MSFLTSGIVIRFTSTNFEVFEPEGFVSVCVELLGEADIDINVEVTVTSDTATQGIYSFQLK